MPDIECEHCGGTDFYKEAGFFYCQGCQVQSQEVQEYVFEDFEQRVLTKKVGSEKTEKVDNKVTSWECYNYILLGLTEELINLGASKKLKAVVRILWLRYLEKMGVFKRQEDQLPKLQAVSSAMDGEIVYGKLAKVRRKRRRSSSSGEVDLTTLDSSSMKQERIKRKRALIKSQYESFSQQSQEPSLHNETLASLQSSEKSSKKTLPITYNYYAARELKRLRTSRFHWRQHRRDFEHNLKCHRVSYRKISHKYRTSPYILSLNKLYAILYLGLLILKDKVQLSDMLRFIKEGHLSFNCYSHFFPEDFSEKVLNFRNFKKNSVFANTPLRVITSEMSVFLQVGYYISCPDLVELSERYCKELNLPQKICDCVQSIIAMTDVTMSYRKRTTRVPNYEGRVLSLILFVVKLLFGLDDVTEFHLGNYANILNRSHLIEPKMFDVIEWLKYIEYRDVVMIHHHFPSNFSNSSDIKDVNLALNTLGKKKYPETKANANRDNYKQILLKLKNDLDTPEDMEFPITLTPYLDYTKLIPKANYLNILSKDFTNESLAHILHPNPFLTIFDKSGKVQIVHGGANEDWVLEKVSCVDYDHKISLKEKRKMVTVKLSFDPSLKTESKVRKEKPDCEGLKKNFQAANASKFLRNLRLLATKDTSDLDVKRIRKELNVSLEDYPKHYNPYERFWMRTKLRIESSTQEECKKFLEEFPHNFRLAFKECQRIAQQNEQEFITEYQFTELYLVYVANFGKKSQNQKKIKDRLIAIYLDNCRDFW